MAGPPTPPCSVTGEGEPGDTITVTRPDTGDVACAAVVQADGTFTCPLVPR
ncbi:MAG: Ig-like domain-containing protein, partial [Bifidobacteriaceae bacterium]|nr:Ig-like domain-containing protein [Bifidobacteriaceae bacterium]